MSLREVGGSSLSESQQDSSDELAPLPNDSVISNDDFYNSLFGATPDAVTVSPIKTPRRPSSFSRRPGGNISRRSPSKLSPRALSGTLSKGSIAGSMASFNSFSSLATPRRTLRQNFLPSVQDPEEEYRALELRSKVNLLTPRSSEVASLELREAYYAAESATEAGKLDLPIAAEAVDIAKTNLRRELAVVDRTSLEWARREGEAEAEVARHEEALKSAREKDLVSKTILRTLIGALSESADPQNRLIAAQALGLAVEQPSVASVKPSWNGSRLPSEDTRQRSISKTAAKKRRSNSAALAGEERLLATKYRAYTIKRDIRQRKECVAVTKIQTSIRKRQGLRRWRRLFRLRHYRESMYHRAKHFFAGRVSRSFYHWWQTMKQDRRSELIFGRATPRRCLQEWHSSTKKSRRAKMLMMRLFGDLKRRCFSEWRQQLRKMRRSRVFIAGSLVSMKRRVFMSWRDWVRGALRGAHFARGIRNRWKRQVLRAWRVRVQRCELGRGFYRELQARRKRSVLRAWRDRVALVLTADAHLAALKRKRKKRVFESWQRTAVLLRRGTILVKKCKDACCRLKLRAWHLEARQGARLENFLNDGSEHFQREVFRLWAKNASERVSSRKLYKFYDGRLAKVARQFLNAWRGVAVQMRKSKQSGARKRTVRTLLAGSLCPRCGERTPPIKTRVAAKDSVHTLSFAGSCRNCRYEFPRDIIPAKQRPQMLREDSRLLLPTKSTTSLLTPFLLKFVVSPDHHHHSRSKNTGKPPKLMSTVKRRLAAKFANLNVSSVISKGGDGCLVVVEEEDDEEQEHEFLVFNALDALDTEASSATKYL